MTMINYVRNVGGGGVAAVHGCRSRARRPQVPQSGPASGGTPVARVPSRRRWGFCSIRSWLAACRRRVVPLMTPFPPIGGGEVAVRGGVAAKVQTHWTKVAENGLFWLNGSALWRICCLSWCVVRTRTRYCEPKPAMSHLNPLFRAWTGLPRLVLAG